jgi:hypothetical protein
MFEWTHTVTSTASPAQVWPLYADIDRWLEWDSGLAGVTIDGAFVPGSSGTLEVHGQPTLAWTLVEVTENVSFTDVTEIPGVAVLTFVHRIEPTAEGSAITHGVRIEGPAAAELGPMVTSDTPEAMATLARIAAGA